MALTADSLQLGPFHGGVRYDLPVEEVKAHELSDMNNTRVGTGGQVEQRFGTDSYKDLAAVNSGATITMCAQFNSTATVDHEIIVAGNKIYDYSSSVWTDRTGGLTITAGNDNTFEWVNANGTLVATNGVNPPFKTAGAANATLLDLDSMFTVPRHITWFDNRLWLGDMGCHQLLQLRWDHYRCNPHPERPDGTYYQRDLCSVSIRERNPAIQPAEDHHKRRDRRQGHRRPA
jgi:hypothetical protein